MVRKKSGSHRQTLKDKYKIDKKCKEHKRKMRKQQRLSGGAGTNKKAKSDPGVPNLWPFKDRIIAKVAADKERAAEAKIKAKQQRNALMARLKKAQKVTEEDVKEDTLKTADEQNYAKRRWYFKEMNKVITMSDVILEVVDARDPMGCRCIEIERRIQQMSASGSNKRIVIVLNKIDLVPNEVATAWVKRLRKEFPTVAFKASTQQQKGQSQAHVTKLGKASEGLLNSGKCVGASVLMQLLKNYCRSHDVKTAITVGIIGYPNVGKSSIVNSMKRARVAGVGATPGFTKDISAIKIDKYINMLDSPGVLFSPDCSQSDLVLRNCIKLEHCEDPVEAVCAIVGKCPKEQLLQIYKIADYNSPEEFISHVAHKRGKMKKGGVPDLGTAARTILKDWTSGEIPYYTLPPAAPAASIHDSTEIVSSWAKEFDLNSLEDMHTREISSVQNSTSMDFIQMPSSAPLQMTDEAADEADQAGGMGDGGMEDESDDEDTSQVRVAPKKEKIAAAARPQENPMAPDSQVNLQKKKDMKKAANDKRRGAGMEDDGGDAYNFETDFS